MAWGKEPRGGVSAERNQAGAWDGPGAQPERSASLRGLSASSRASSNPTFDSS